MKKLGTTENRNPRQIQSPKQVGFEFRIYLPSPLLDEQENTFLIRYDDVGKAVAIDIGHFKLGADSGIVVDLMRREADQSIRAALGLEPVERRRIIRIDVPFRAVRPPALAGHQVFET